MTNEEAQALRRENAYLRARCAELQNDVDDLGAQLRRMQEQAAPGQARTRTAPTPLSGGQ